MNGLAFPSSTTSEDAVVSLWNRWGRRRWRALQRVVDSRGLHSGAWLVGVLFALVLVETGAGRGLFAQVPTPSVQGDPGDERDAAEATAARVVAARLKAAQVDGAQPAEASKAAEEKSVEKEPSEKEAPAKESKDPVFGEAFRLSQNAKGEADYSRIVVICEEALAQQGVPQKKQEYAATLAGWAYNRRGQIKIARQDRTGAMEDFDAAIERDPKRWQPYLQRGVAFAQDGKFAEAVEDFTKVVEIQPKEPRGWFNRGEANYARGQFQLAVDDYTEAAKLKADDVDVLVRRGHAYYKLGDDAKALADFTKAISVDSRFSEAYIFRGDLRLDQGDYPQAAQDYRAAVRLAPQSHRALVSLAWLLATCPRNEIRDPQSAAAYAVRAVQLLGESEPENRHRYFDVLAAAQAAGGNFEQAAQTAVRAISTAPKADEGAYRERLEMYQRRQAFQHLASPPNSRKPVRSSDPDT